MVAPRTTWPISHLLLLLALALTLPLLAVSIYGLSALTQADQAALSSRMAETLAVRAAAVERELERNIAILNALAASPLLAEHDIEKFHAHAAAALPRDMSAIVLLDLDGNQLLDTLKPYGAQLPKTANQAWADEVVRSGLPSVSGVFRGSISGRPVFNVGVPVRFDGAVRYVLALSFQAATVRDLIVNPPLPAPWLIGIVDAAGRVLARSEKQDEFVLGDIPPDLLRQIRTTRGVFRSTTIDGADILRGAVNIANAEWILTAALPYSEATQSLRQSRIFSGLLLGMGLFLTGVAFLAGRMITRAINLAERTATDLGHGAAVRASTTRIAEVNNVMDAMRRASVELRERSERTQVLLGEVAHRAKNQLAVVKSMAIQSGRQHSDLPAFLKALAGRVDALARSHNALMSHEWVGADMGELVRSHFTLIASGARLESGGPRLTLGPHAAQNLGFALHELTVNAARFGVLAQKDGPAIRVSWQRDGDRVTFDWREPDLTAGADLERGFGTRVLTDLVPRALEGSASLLRSDGTLSYSLIFSAQFLAQTSEPR